jgi:heme o synthase
MNNSGNKLLYYLKLSKLKIMLPVSLTGFTGYFIFNPHLSFNIFLVSLGILLLAVAASVLNQIQEADLDSKMSRTMDRPIPARKILLKHAILFLLFNLLSGFFVIYIFGNFKAALIGLITILWYNVIYTYLKRITAFAVVPGSVTGALPLLIGWVAAGGGIWDRTIVLLEFLFFFGQIPHFWILIMRYGDEYKNAGIPSLTDLFNRFQISRLTFAWVVSSVIAVLLLCYFEIIQSSLIIGILIIASLYLVWEFTGLLKTGENNKNFLRYSTLLNSYFLLIIMLLITDRIIF